MNKLVFIENGFVEYTRMESALQTVKDIEQKIEDMLRRERTASFEERWNQLYVDLDNARKGVKLAAREDLETPHNCTAEIEAPDVGAPLDELESYAAEFHKLIEEMFEKLPTETRVLEGTEIASYDQLREEAHKNELSETKEKEDNGQCTGSVDS